MGDIVKSGYIKRYSKSFLSGGWNKSFLTLYRDSRLCVYKRQGDSTVQGSIFMKEVCKCFAYGEYTNGMPERPQVPAGYSIDCLMGIPLKPSKQAKIHWFLFSNPAELHEWMTAICSILPPPPAKDPNAHHTQQYAPPVNSAPPAQQYVHAPPPPGGPGPALGFENLTLGGAPPPAAPYQPPPPGYPAAQPYYPPGPAPAVPPPPASYPQQTYYHPGPAPAYPQQSYQYHPPPVQGGVYYQQPVQYVQGGYPQQAYGYNQQPRVVYQTQPVQVVHKTKSGGSNMGKMAAGIAGGALIGYGASRMMGGGWGLGRWGSWSSMSSFGSFGSCGSFGSFGSFD